MRLPPYSWIAFGGVLSLVFWGGVLPRQNPLGAAGNGVAALADSDGDGLDDALEMRLGTDPALADTDTDQVSDLEELLRGSDPAAFNAPGSVPSPTAQLRIEVYQVGADFILQVFALRQSGVSDFRLYRTLDWGIKGFTYSSLTNRIVDLVSTPATVPGWTMDRLRLQVPSSWFDLHPAASFTVEGIVDGQHLADQVFLTHAGSEVAEAYAMMAAQGVRHSHALANLSLLGLPSESGGGATSGGGSGNSTSGGGGVVGLSPVEPVGEAPPPSRGTPDEVCLQLLAPSANLGNGRVQYTVVDASCNASPGSLCLAGCALTVGDTLVGIDVVGLLGG